MNVLIIGASGATGRELVRQAIAKNYRVTALVRSPEKFELKADNLIVVKGDVADKASLINAVKDQDAVLVALGPRGLGKTSIQETFARNIIEAMHTEDIIRIINLSAWGAGDNQRHMHVGFKVMRYSLLKNVFDDKERGERLLTGSDLDYTMAQPGRLMDGAAKGGVRGSLTNDENLSQAISRADVAGFMLAQLETDKWSRKSPLIGY